MKKLLLFVFGSLALFTFPGCGDGGNDSGNGSDKSGNLALILKSLLDKKAPQKQEVKEIPKSSPGSSSPQPPSPVAPQKNNPPTPASHTRRQPQKSDRPPQKGEKSGGGGPCPPGAPTKSNSPWCNTPSKRPLNPKIIKIPTPSEADIWEKTMAKVAKLSYAKETHFAPLGAAGTALKKLSDNHYFFHGICAFSGDAQQANSTVEITGEIVVIGDIVQLLDVTFLR